MSGAPLPNKVSRGYHYVMKMPTICYFAFKYSFSHKLLFVIFPAIQNLLSLLLIFLITLGNTIHLWSRPQILMSFLIACSSHQHWKIYPNIAAIAFLTLSVSNLSQRLDFLQLWGTGEFRVNNNSFGLVISNLIL